MLATVKQTDTDYQITVCVNGTLWGCDVPCDDTPFSGPIFDCIPEDDRIAVSSGDDTATISLPDDLLYDLHFVDVSVELADQFCTNL